MARLHFAALLFAAALVVTSGARLPLQAAAPAPAPGAAHNGADVLFIMEADQGTFTDAQTLTLSGLTGSAQSFAVGGKTAVYPIAAFVGNQFVDSTGAWLGNPQAVFYGVNAQGNTTSAVLALSSPKINTPAPGTNNNNNNNNNGGTITNNNNNNGQTLSFTVAAVPADASKVKMPGGAVSQKVSEAASGANNGFVSTIAPGTQLTNIVLFIDTNQQSVNDVAATKWGWGGFFQPNYGYQGYNNGWGSYNNNNNNNNNGGWGAVNNNNNNNNNGGYGAVNNNNNNNNNGGFGAVNNNNNNNNNGFGGANNNNNNNNNGRH